MASSSPPAAVPARNFGIVIFLFWVLLWALLPALLVWSTEPFMRRATFVPAGQTDAELTAELNHQLARQLLILGGLFGVVGGAVAVLLRKGWQVIALAVVVGVALVAVFDLRIGPPDLTWESVAANALTQGGISGVLLGALLLVVHIRTGRCT